MRRLLIALLLTLSPAVLAQTNVSGALTTDTTWDLAGSPYIVTATVTVSGTDGADGVTTLTIDPGVEVRVANNFAELKAGTFFDPGRIIADGNNGPGAPAQIVFTSDFATPAAGDWRRILLDGSEGGSILRNVLIEYAGRNSFDGGVVDISHTNGTVTLDQITIRRSNFDGIRLATGAFSISNCTIEDETEYSIQVDSSATVVGTISDCDLKSVIYPFSAAPQVTWQNNSFTDWGARTSKLGADDFGDFLANNTIVNSVPDAVVELLANGVVTRDAQWSTDAGTIRLLGATSVRGTDGADGVTTLRIDPGARIELANFGAISVASATVPGALVADGDDGPGAPAEILFTSSSASPVRGAWRRIYLDRLTDASSRLRNVRIEYAGQLTNDAGLHVFNTSGPIVLDGLTIVESGDYGLRIAGPIDLTNCTIRDTDAPAVRIEPLFGLVATVDGCQIADFEYLGPQPQIEWTNNTFIDWGAPASLANPDAVASLTTGGNSFSDPSAGLDVRLGDTPRSGSWAPTAGPIRMQGTLTIAGNDDPVITFLPGLELQMPASAQIAVGKSLFPTQPGSLVAEGDPGNPILLTSIEATPAPGDWKGVSVSSFASLGTRFRDVIVEYHGESSFDAGIRLSQGAHSIPVERVTIREGASDGLRHDFGTLDLRDSAIHDVAGFGVRLADNTTVGGSASGNTIESLWYDGIDPVVSWSGNSFENWGATTSRIISTSVDEFTHDNSFQLVPGGTTRVLTTRLDGDASWSKAAGPLVLEGSQIVDGVDGSGNVTTLTLEPGVELRLAAASQIFVGGVGFPGRLVADGRLGNGTLEPVRITSSEPVPAAGQTQGIQVLDNGTIELYETELEYGSVGVQSSGTIDAIEGLTVRETGTGLLLTSIGSVASTLTRLDFQNVDIGISSSNQFLTIRDSNLIGTTMGVENSSPAAFCIDAMSNYWGAIDGPSGNAPTQGCELDLATGAGSSLTEGVQFDNFLTEPFVGPAPAVRIVNLRFSDADTAIWDLAPGSVEYHVYRQPLTALGPAPFATCRDDLDIDRTDLELIDIELPFAGEGFSYLISGEGADGQAGPLGDATAGERSAAAICP